MNFNKTLLFTAFVALQSIAYASDIRGGRVNETRFLLGGNPSTYTPVARPSASTIGTVLTNHASDHADYTEKEAEDAKLAYFVAVIERYNNQPNPKNGTLKPGYAEWKEAVQYVEDHAREYISYAHGAILQATTVLQVLPKSTLEAKTADAELRMAINALEGALKNI